MLSVLSISECLNHYFPLTRKSNLRWLRKVFLLRLLFGFHAGIMRFHAKTRRERPKSAPYLRLKNIQGTAIGNFWKFFFSKKLFLNFFFEKSIFLENRTMPQKLKKRPFRLIERFYKPKTSKKCN